MDYRNDSQDLSKNTILYGHHAKDGTMFKHLMKFKDEEFFKKHPTFTFHTLEASYEAEIFAVYPKTTDFNYIQTDFGSDEEFEQFLEKTREHSLYIPKWKSMQTTSL